MADSSMGRGFLVTREIDGESIGLDVSSGIPEMVTNDRREALTPDEMVAFQADGGLQRMVSQLSEPDSATGTGDGFDSLRAQIPPGFNVMLDTTTIRNAVLALLSPSPSPLALLDLAALSTAIVCFDNVLVQPLHIGLSGISEFGIRVLEQPRELLQGPLWSICVSAEKRLSRDNQWRETIEAAWADFLGWPSEDTHLDIRAWDKYTNSPASFDGIVAGDYMDQLFMEDKMGGSSAQFLGIQTMRSMVNYELASRLSMPYLAASLRSPVQSLILRENHERQLILDRLVGALSPAPTRPVTGLEGPYSLDYSAPFILGLVLERMQHPNDYWKVVAQYRKRFHPLRERLLQDREEWDGRVGPYVREMLQGIGIASRLVQEGEQAAVEAGAALVSGALGGVAGASASLGLKLISLLYPAERVRRCYYRWFRPELYLLISLSDEAERLRALDKRVESIWNFRWDAAHYRQLDILRAANPAAFLRLGTLQ